MTTPFLFAIPLISKSAAKDWRRVCQLLACTLDSVLHQTDPDFSVCLVCHDIPDVSEVPQLKDPRVSILVATSPTPATPNAQMYDKGHKKRLAYAHLRSLGGGWVMLVDADDLISKHLLAYVRKSNAQFGLIIDRGWEFDCQTQKLRSAQRFNRMCGSSGIFKFTPEELPSDALQSDTTLSDAYGSHRLWREKSAALARPLDFIDFRAAIYTINNQQNHSHLVRNIGWRRSLLRAISPSHSPKKSEIEEFSMTELLNLS